jgi:two-component system, cell cycle response regulator
MDTRTILKKTTDGRVSPGHLSLDLIPDPFIVLKSDGEIFDLNRSCCLLLGAKKSQLLNRNFKELKKFSRLWKKVEHAMLEKKENTERMSFDSRNFEIYILPFKAGPKTYHVRIIFKDITTFLRLETELLKRNKELIIMNNLSSAFISSDNLDLVMEDLMDKIFLITDFHTGWLLLQENNELSLKTSRGISSEVRTGIEKGALTSLCANTIKMREPLSVVEADELSKIPFLHDQGIVFLVIVPLISERRATGLLFLASRVGRNVDLEFASLMALVGNHVTHIIGKIKLFLETKRLSITDALTGLYNTRYFYKTLELEIARTNRYGNPFSLMLFDIDNFKLLNDNHGHQAGDEVLQELAQILKSISRETDTSVRYGGEEFIIVLPNTPEEETIFLADRIRKAVQEHNFIVSSKEKVNITLSGGIASYPKNAEDAKSLLNAADSALYAAKAAGKNVVLCYEGINPC